ncbi:MAG: glycosyltransferase, partial [Candidatus Magasanikbacteria bacterium]|nr:glycosyltransferase [Candidatus Magasanikbacteria bacterium]
MRIGIDARMYGPKQAGLGRYVRQLITGLLEIDRENQYVLYVRNYEQQHEITPPKADAPWAQNYENCKIVIVDIPWYSWREQVEFKKIIQKEKVDLMHFPHWNVPLFYNDPFVVTIHDLIMYHYPRPEATTLGPIKFWLKDMAHRIVLRHAVKKAKKIIVTSEFTKQDVYKTLGVELEKTIVIYQAPVVRTQNTINKTQLLEKFRINKPYVLYVGNAYPHMNLERLLKAWGIFEKKYGDGFQLV